MKNPINLALLITGFFVVGGFVYWALGFFKNLLIPVVRSILAIVITIIIGWIILKRKNLKISKSNKR